MNIDYKNIERKNKLSKVEVDYLLYGNKYPFLVEQLNTMKATHDCGCGHGVQVAGSLSLVRSTATGKVISLDPKLGQGYLVMNRLSNPKVDVWRIIVSSSNIRKGKLVSEREVERTELYNGVNWWKVPGRYLSAEGVFTINVQGISISDSIVVEEGPLLVSNPLNPGVGLNNGGTPWLMGCSWQCNGRGYAWEIKQAVNPTGNNGYYLWLTTAYASFNEDTQAAIPYYSYYPIGTFESMNLTLDGVNVIGPLASSLTPSTNLPTFRDDDGMPIAGAAFGVAKGLGQWDNIGGVMTPVLDSSPIVCHESRNWAIGQINQYALPQPPLVCISSWQDGLDGGGDSSESSSCLQGTTMVGCEGSFEECFTKYMDDISLCLCTDGDDFVGGFGCDPDENVGGPWYDKETFISEVFISDLNHPDRPSVRIDVAKFKQAVGIQGLPRTWRDLGLSNMTSSLYALGLSTKVGKYAYFVREFRVKR